MNGEVNCPTHGTHGVLSNGQCWYCVQAGTVSASVRRPITAQRTITTDNRTVGTRRKIT